MKGRKRKFLIGTSGWSYLHWRDRFYPKELSSYRWLEYYARYFLTAEVNMTFYKWPNESLLKNWYKRTPKGFSFTLKAPKLITHIKKLKGVAKLIKDFYRLADSLQDKLACILFQLPPSLKFSQEKLKNFLKYLNKKYKNVIEFRDKSWWCSETYDLLRKHKISFCIVSGPKLPSDSIVTSPVAYFRFHGLEWYRSNYPAIELKKWAERIKKISSKCEKVYCYFNNDYNAYAVKNALELRKLLKA
jgi:uncharacterized protein YecE (DUF72 family)